MPPDLGRGPAHDGRTLVHRRHAVAQGKDERNVVLHDHDRQRVGAVRPERLQQAADQMHLRRRQPGRRFIEQQQARPAHQRPSDLHLAMLAERQRADRRLVRELEPDPAEPLRRCPPQFRLLGPGLGRADHAAEQPRLRPAMPAAHDVFERRQVREDRRGLEGPSDAGLRDEMRLAGQGRAVDHDPAALQRHEAGQHIDRRRLAGAVRPDDAVHLALAHGHAEPIERVHPAERHPQVAGLEHGAHVRRAHGPRRRRTSDRAPADRPAGISTRVSSRMPP